MKKGAPSVNPNGRKGKTNSRKDSAPRGDGYISTLTGLGTTTHDKRIQTYFNSDIITRNDALHLWAGDDIAARAVDIPVEDAFRQGFDFTAKAKEGADLDTKEIQDTVEKLWTDLGALDALAMGMGYEMAYGGAGVMPIYEGMRPEDLAREIRPGRFRELKGFNVFEPEELPAHLYRVVPWELDYGKPYSYTLAPIVTGTGEGGRTSNMQGQPEILASNLIILPGIRPTKGVELDNLTKGWGVSVYTRLWRVLRDFNTAWGGVGNLVVDFSQTVLKLKDLAQLLAEQGGTEKLKNRLQGMDLGRSILRAVVIDSDEEMERKTTTVTGLSEILTQYMARVSSAAGGMPITKLFGVPPSGLNSSGESDIAQWDDRVKAMQDKKVIPHLRRITEIMIESGMVPNAEGLESWEITARPLRQQTDQEKATTRYQVAQTDQIYYNMGALSDSDIANSRFGGDAYSMETVVDWEERERLEREMEQAAQTNPEDAARLLQGQDAPGESDEDEEEPDNADDESPEGEE